MDDSPNISADDGRAIAVVAAIQGGDVAGLRHLLEENTGLVRARIVDSRGVARTLLHIAADWPDTFQVVPRRSRRCWLHACRGGQLTVAKYLLERGADRNWIGHDKKTPLDVARESGASDLVSWLEESGARPARS